MKTLITGASGFVGSAVLRALLRAGGFDTRVLVRPQSDRRNLMGLPVELVTGDLRDRPSLRRAVHGVKALFHIAADYRLWARRPLDLYETNVQGTGDIMAASLAEGVERIVYTSSVATLGLHKDGTPADEDTPSSLSDMTGHYKRSKFLAEAVVHRLVREKGLPAVIVNPSTPVGPRDIKPTPTGQMILEAAGGRMPAYVDTGLNLVHVDDVAEGHILAFEKGRIGQRYILGAKNMALREILYKLAAVTGHSPPRFRLHHALLLPLAYMVEGWARITGSDAPLVTVDGVKLARKRMFFSIEKATRELGFRPRPVVGALRDAVTWFEKNGYLR